VTSAEKEAWGAYGPALQLAMFQRGEQPDPVEVEAFAKQARELFARG
jgi:hypothetical protein